MPLLGTGFSIGSSGNDDGMGKSLDDIIADRRKEQAKASTGKNAKKNGKTDAKAKKTAVADRSIATGRAKRAAATRARRGLSGSNSNNNNNNNANNTNGKKAKPSAMEVEKEVYRQARKTAESKKKAEQKKTQGRLPPNSSLRSKKNNKTKAAGANANANDPPGIVTGLQPSQKQIKAALKGMETAGCPIPNGYQIMVQFIPPAAAPAPAKGKGSQAKKITGGRGGRGGKK